MDCPHCKYPDMRVIDSRPHEVDNMRRRRWCSKCGHRVTTEERIKEPAKKDKSYVHIL